MGINLNRRGASTEADIVWLWRSAKEMNSYTKTLDSAFSEIDSFEKTEEGKKWDSGWYQRICDLVEKTKNEETDEEAERYLDMLLWCIVDSGPLTAGFAPSIQKAADAMQRKRKAQHKAKRLAKNERPNNKGSCRLSSRKSN